MYEIGWYTDIDQTKIGSDTVIDGYVWQIHSFEDRVFWVERCEIGEKCVIHPDVVLMGGSSVGGKTEVGAGSCVWKLSGVGPGGNSNEGKSESIMHVQGHPATECRRKIGPKY